MTPFERSLSKLSENHKHRIHGIQVIAAQRVPEPLIKREGGVRETISQPLPTMYTVGPHLYTILHT